MEALTQRCVMGPVGQRAPHVRGRCGSAAKVLVATAARRSHLALASRSGGRGNAVSAPAAGPSKSGSSAQESAPLPPSGCARYETMLLLRPNATEAERGAELAKIATFLGERGAGDYHVTTRPELSPGKSAYPIKGHTTVYYVQLNYAAPPATVKALHEMFAVPVVGAEAVLLRYLSFRQSKVSP